MEDQKETPPHEKVGGGRFRNVANRLGIAVSPSDDEMALVVRIASFRQKQTRTSRLCEYVTGFRLEDPKLLDKLEADQRVVRQRYGLPDRGCKFENPEGYEQLLRKLAEDNGIEVRPTSDCAPFFVQGTIAEAVHFEENGRQVVGVDFFDEGSTVAYMKSLALLEHELIHSLQAIYFPEMSIELQEYEAYVCGWSINCLRGDPGLVNTVFDFGVEVSVDYWYREKLKEGEDVRLEWDSPSFFLENRDGIFEETLGQR